MPLVTVSEDRYGNLTVRPRSARLCARIERHLDAAGTRNADSSFYLQGDDGADFLADLSPRAARDVRAGWDVTARLDADLLAALVGYDFTI
jgi:hypothetical protein